MSKEQVKKEYKKVLWNTIDIIMIFISIILIFSSFPLQEWEWGYTNKKFEISLLFLIGYMSTRANLK